MGISQYEFFTHNLNDRHEEILLNLGRAHDLGELGFRCFVRGPEIALVVGNKYYSLAVEKNTQPTNAYSQPAAQVESR